MAIEIHQETIASLDEYAGISVAFQVTSILDVTGEPGRFALTERQLRTPYTKDYDAIDGNNPVTWPQRFSVDEWGLFSARTNGRWVGAVAVAHDAVHVLATGDGSYASVLWDLRVSPTSRGTGIGRQLFVAAEQWSRVQKKRRMLAETQNINVAACRFYERNGCTLGAMDRAAYPTLPDEIRLVWSKQLQDRPGAG